jgi:uncharacterized membrane-anchored protein
MIVLISGVLLLLGAVVLLDFYQSNMANQAPDQDIIHLLEKTLTGTMGVIAGYFVSRIGSRDESQ